MIKQVLFGAMVLAALLSFGCGNQLKHTTIFGAGVPVQGAPTYHEWQHHFIYGLVGASVVDVYRICPSGNATVFNKINFGNFLVAGLTFGLYTPTVVKIYCSGGPITEIELTAEQVKTAALSPEFIEFVETYMPERSEEIRAIQARARSEFQNGE